MYKMLIAIMFSMLIAHAEDNKSITQVNMDSLVSELDGLSIYGQTMAEEEPIQVAQSSCYGYATCWGPWGPYQVSCSSYGTGCTWESFSGHGVRCTSVDRWGNYFYTWGRC